MSAVNAAIPILASFVSAVFAGSVALQWWRRRKPHQLFWALGLAMFAIAAAMQAASEFQGWSDSAFRTYYATAQPLVGFLGVGAAYLVSKKAGQYYALANVAIYFVFLGLLVAAPPIDPMKFAGVEPSMVTAASVLPTSVRYLAFLFTLPGTGVLIGVAVYSYWKTRLSFNLLIAVGVVTVAIGGSLARLGYPSLLYGAVLLGAVLLYLGFLKAAGLPKTAAVSEPTKAG